MAKTSFVPNPAKIKVIGLGGGGCNAITRMVREDIQGVEFIAVNTDAQALSITEAPTRIQLGEKTSKGLGVGGDHNLGQKAAEENRDEIKELVSGADMVFVTCGMGGGTGTGAAPVVAEVAKQSGALTIAVVTRPFTFEGTHRCQVADEGITRLLDKVDTLIIIPNNRLLELCDQKTAVDNAFKLADDVLRHGVQAIAEVITVPGLINEALASPLLDVSIDGSRGVLFNVVGGTSLSLFEVNEAAEVIKQAVAPDANIIFGVGHEAAMDKEIRITLIATGFASKTGLTGVSREDEFNQLLKGLKSEDELDVPSFLRRPLFSHRRQAITPSTKLTTKAPMHTPSG